jgi:hypothetical protein
MDKLMKIDLQKKIDKEHGINYHRNVDLSNSYTVSRNNSFISFKFVEINGINTVEISYIYITDKTSLLKLITWCINFWSGNAVKYIYYKEHVKKSNVVEKFLKPLGFNVEYRDYNGWKHEWTSTNGYKESNILEMYTS